MATNAVLLAILPVIVLAIPVWDKLQHAFTPTDTLADTKVYVDNQMPVEVSLYMTHMRGDDSDTKGAHNFVFIPTSYALDDYCPLNLRRVLHPPLISQNSQFTLSSQKGLGQVASWYSVSRR